MSKGSNSTVTDTTNTVAPNAEASRAYSDLMARALGVSQTPYEAFSGEEVAPINATQQAGIGNISSFASRFAPFGQQAGENIAGGTSAVNANDIAQYYDPYQQSVIDSTMADFDTMNKRANSITTGNAASANALGGNRVGVAQALTQEGQTRTQAPVIAGLRSKGFQNAEEMANAQKTRQLQGGQAELAGGLNTAGAQLAAGTTEQQTKQAQDTQARADFFQQQGYPFATAQWLASIVLPTGSQMGSTTSGHSNVQGPEPNQWMQLAGAGLGAAAAFSDRRLKENVKEVGELHDGQKVYRYNFKGDPKTQIGLISQEVEKTHPDAVGKRAGFGTVDYDAATADAVKRFYGGRIAGFASGGSPFAGGWVPDAQVQGHPLQAQEYKIPKMADMPKDQTGGMGKSIGQIGKGLFDKSNSVPEPLDNYNPEQDTSNANYGVGPELPGFYGSGDAPSFGGGFGGGGWARGGGVRRGFADGGVPVSTGFGGGFDDDMSPNDAVNERFANPMLGSDQYKDIGGHSRALVSEGLERRPVDNMVAENVPMPPARPGGVAREDIVPKAMEAFKSIKGGEAPAQALAFDDDGSTPTDISAARRMAPQVRSDERQIVPPGVGAGKSDMGGFNPLGLGDEARQGLISMGLSMMANRRGGKGSALASIGEGGEQGMTTYASAKAATNANDTLRRKEAFEREKFERPFKEQTADQRARSDQGRYSVIPGVTTADGSPIERDTHHPDRPPINAVTRKPLTQEEMNGVKTGINWKPLPNKVTETGAPVFTNSQGQMMEAGTGRILGAGDKVVDVKAVALSPDALKSRGYQLALGDLKSAYGGMGFGNAAAQNKNAVYEQALSTLIKDGGMTAQAAAEYLTAQSQEFTAKGIGMNAEARTAATREANLKIILAATEAAIPAALEASAEVKRTGLVPLNRIIEKGRLITSDPRLVKFGMANLQLAEHWARAMNPTGVMRESDRDKALHFLDTALSHDTYEAAVRQLDKQIKAEKTAVEKVKAQNGAHAALGKADALTGDQARAALDGASAGPPPGATPPARSAEDQAALSWANANPTDPRAAAIKERLGVK